MKPEDLGIKPFTPAPDPKTELQQKADVASARDSSHALDVALTAWIAADRPGLPREKAEK